MNQLYLFLVMIITIGSVFTGTLLFYHGKLMIKGRVTHERNKKLNEYDQGTEKNIEEALGKRWRLVWLAPFLESELPSDGIHWNVMASEKAK